MEKKEFTNSLAYLLLIDKNDIYSRLLYLNRLSFGAGLDFGAEEIYKNGLEFEMKDLDALCVELQKYKHIYLVEAFIMVNISEKAPVNMLQVLADMAKLMGCDKEEICVIAAVAKAKLQNNLDVLESLPISSKNRWSNCFPDYIDEDWIISKRVKCGSLCIVKVEKSESLGSFYAGILSNRSPEIRWKSTYPCVVEKRIPDAEAVKKGDVIVVYKEDEKEKTIIAPCDGVVYAYGDGKPYKEKTKTIFYSDEKQPDRYLRFYVVSYFDDYEKFHKWCSKKNKKA